MGRKLHYVVFIIFVILGLTLALALTFGILVAIALIVCCALICLLQVKRKHKTKLNRPENQRSFLNFALIVALFGFTNGCAFGVTKLDITHNPLNTIESKRQGKILVREFVDKRDREKKQFIGNKRNTFGMVLGHFATKEDLKLEIILTEYFAEALKEAGYNVVIHRTETGDEEKGIEFDAIVQGEITKFWLDAYMITWHIVAVSITVLDQNNQEIVWEGGVLGEEKNPLWVGVKAPPPEVVAWDVGPERYPGLSRFT